MLFLCQNLRLHKLKNRGIARGETRTLIGGGGCEYSYIRVLPDEFLFKLTLMTADFKRNSSGRTRRYEYSPPPPQINALVSPLGIACEKKLFLLHVLDFNAIFADQDPLPTLRRGNFDLHTKMPGIRPCLSRSILMSSLCRFTSRRQTE